MSGSMETTFMLLRVPGDEWDQVADLLDGVWRRLHKASVASFEPDVAAALETFRETWVDAVKSAATAAQDHAETLQLAASHYEMVDIAAYENLRRLLPWTMRETTFLPPRPLQAGF